MCNREMKSAQSGNSLNRTSERSEKKIYLSSQEGVLPKEDRQTLTKSHDKSKNDVFKKRFNVLYSTKSFNNFILNLCKF